MEYILKTVDSIPKLKNKRELLERFIEENREIFSIEFKGNLEDKLQKFMKKKRDEAILEMVAEEELSFGKVNEIC